MQNADWNELFCEEHRANCLLHFLILHLTQRRILWRADQLLIGSPVSSLSTRFVPPLLSLMSARSTLMSFRLFRGVTPTGMTIPLLLLEWALERRWLPWQLVRKALSLKLKSSAAWPAVMTATVRGGKTERDIYHSRLQRALLFWSWTSFAPLRRFYTLFSFIVCIDLHACVLTGLSDSTCL